MGGWDLDKVDDAAVWLESAVWDESSLRALDSRRESDVLRDLSWGRCSVGEVGDELLESGLRFAGKWLVLQVNGGVVCTVGLGGPEPVEEEVVGWVFGRRWGSRAALLSDRAAFEALDPFLGSALTTRSPSSILTSTTWTSVSVARLPRLSLSSDGFVFTTDMVR